MPTRGNLATLVLTICALALLAAGCGGGGDTTTIVEREVVAPSQGEDEQETGTSGTGQEEGAEAPISEAPAEFVELRSFQSPSGNIGCFVTNGSARCDIADRSWSAPRPKGCPAESDYGQGLRVSQGPGQVVCGGDTALDPGAPKLAYGTASEVGDFICISRKTGITCSQVPSGHGFFINKDEYRTF
jgi:hypothetical protein